MNANENFIKADASGSASGSHDEPSEDPRHDPSRVIRAPRGTTLNCKSWLTEAAYRMLQNNLDAEVAERPQDLVVYGGIGRAARNWACFDQILESLRKLEDDESLLVQSGKPVGVFKTHENAPRVLIANSNLVPKWANWEHFNELDRKGLFMYGQMTAGSWIYIGSQGIVQGTFETFVEAGRQHYGNSLVGRWILTAGLGGMGGAQPLAATLAGASSLTIECQQSEDEVSVQLEDRYVNPKMAPDFIRQDFSTQQPSEYLVRHVPFDEIEHVVDSILPTPEQARLLQIDATQPCLMLTRRTWSAGTPVTLVRCLHPGQRYRLGSRFRADGVAVKA